VRKELGYDERWPEVLVYPVRASGRPHAGFVAVDVPDELLRRHESALMEFDAVQEELVRIFEKASHE